MFLTVSRRVPCGCAILTWYLRHLPRIFRNESGSCPHRGELQDSVQKTRNCSRRSGRPDEVFKKVGTSCRRCQESHFRVLSAPTFACLQNLDADKISAPEDPEAFRNDEDSARTERRVAAGRGGSRKGCGIAEICFPGLVRDLSWLQWIGGFTISDIQKINTSIEIYHKHFEKPQIIIIFFLNVCQGKQPPRWVFRLWL